MNDELKRQLNEFLKNEDVSDDEKLEEKIQEFAKRYNDLEYEKTALDDAYDLLEEAENTRSSIKAMKLAKEAYMMCPECFDAILFQVDLEKNDYEKEKLLKEGLDSEKERLTKEGYFKKENIGSFYGMFETRPYMRGLFAKLSLLLIDGKLKQARDLCKEILELNTSDNLGARYFLMAIYATLEEEKEMLALYKKYPEDNLEMLFPLFALYYKLGNDEKANKYLKEVNQANPNLLKFLKGKFMEDDDMKEDMIEGRYSIGELSEVVMYFGNYGFLFNTSPNMGEYIIRNLNNNKRNK